MSHPSIFLNNPLKYRGFFIELTLDNYPKTMYSITINEQRRMLDEDLPMLENGDMFIADREVIITEEDGYDDEKEEEYDDTIIKE